MRSNEPVMLSEALQRNAKHEARLSNISDSYFSDAERINQRFFALLRKTTPVLLMKRLP
jgi:hypothetical protein